MTSIYKKIISIILICAVAVATGLSVGKIYLDMNTAPTGLSDMDTVYKASEEEVVALYNRSNGARVADFNAIELWQIAEYKLSLQDKFKRVMTGRVVSAGQPVNMKSTKTKNGDVYTYEKLSPSKNVMGITTPNICSLISYNKKLPNQVNINTSGVFKDSTAASKDLSATFSGTGQIYTQAQYEEIFHTMPDRSVMPYIISDKTCDETCISQVVDNNDGTYTFVISLQGEYLEKAALAYSYEILFSSGYSLPEWSNAKITVTIDSNFMFKTINYIENYTVYNAPVIGKAGVADDFVDQFIYGDEAFAA